MVKWNRYNEKWHLVCTARPCKGSLTKWIIVFCSQISCSIFAAEINSGIKVNIDSDWEYSKKFKH